ncbi:MAG: hypothetical protein RQ872_07330 [Sulfolobaceae archaeon]|nr:hypothetical protein [Sulfolobaceae archaeon]
MEKKGAKNSKKGKALVPIPESIYEDFAELIYSLYKIRVTSFDGIKDPDELPKKKLYELLSNVNYLLRVTKNRDLIDYITFVVLSFFSSRSSLFSLIPITTINKMVKNDEGLRESIRSTLITVLTTYASQIKDYVDPQNLNEQKIINLVSFLPVLSQLSPSVNVIKSDERYSVFINIQGAEKELLEVLADAIINFFTNLGFKTENLKILEQVIKLDLVTISQNK